MSLTKSVNSLVVSVATSVWHQPSGRYGEVCIYKTDPRSVLGASCHHIGCVATKGTGVGWVVGRDIISIAFDVEDDKDHHTGFVDKLVILPRDDGQVILAVGRRMACVCTIPERTAFEAQRVFGSRKE